MSINQLDFPTTCYIVAGAGLSQIVWLVLGWAMVHFQHLPELIAFAPAIALAAFKLGLVLNGIRTTLTAPASGA